MVATLVAVVLAVLLLASPGAQAPAAQAGGPTAVVNVTASASPTPPRTRPPTEPRTEAAAKKAAAKAFDAYAVGDYGRFWDMWTQQAQQVVGRKDYVRRFKLCPQASQGIRWQIQDVAVRGDRATVRAARLILVENYTLAYRAGRWRFVPQPETLAPYRTKTIEQIVAADKAEGGCARS
ncbi:hypothetical protein [Nonomuraea soli]|uniref:Uncharacterized protein n=1 Tax=Nonomuraea soli TaxID=1032476 RepID=A0A7W0CI99_9ACTN|nr:hypothetical protein [Nonomuraea soli]MBA2891618.1 hypothetical protein [Nonomuraea soli]